MNLLNVLTLVHGRRAHLANLIRGLEQSTVMPRALVIVQMNEAPFQWASKHFPIIHRAIDSGDDQLPLAAARNAAVDHAPGDHLVFLDVDCIPAPNLLARYRKVLVRPENVLYQGEVLYLPPGAADENTQPEILAQKGVPHALHTGRHAGEAVPHALFWSLNFACRRETFEHVGRFDTQYRGYGAEDTDFAFRAAAAGVPVEFVPAPAFHQFHPSFDPPLNHLASIVANATLFRERWGAWPMDGWLRQFCEAGFIEMDEKKIVLRRMPTRDEISSTLREC
ncbi:glycosyltransferase family 2 protein [Caballeronia sp. 15715]|uniref:glycosyltransferase family 2 protein n=1 Tax=unclassified Caballeronia TaxID=2646786 RepID=UPI0039E3897C